MKGTCIFILALLTNAVNSYIGVIIMADEDSQAKSFQCMIQSGYNVLTSVIQSDIDSIQQIDIDILYKAKTMFKAVDYHYLSCRGRDPIEQAKQFMSKVPQQLWSTVWILPELGLDDDDQCSASTYSKKDNCEYLKKMLEQFSKYKIKTGIMVSSAQWEKFAGNECDQVGSYPLYWFQQDEYPFFSNFVAFGGWAYPSVKTYAGVTVCGIYVPLTYRKQLYPSLSD